MTSANGGVSRPLVGALAAGLLFVGTVMAVLPHAASPSQWELFQGACLRVGLVMTAFWLALPLLERNKAGARAFGGFLIIGVLVLVVLRRIPLRIVLPVAIVLGILGLILRPRPKQRPRNQP